MGQPPLPEPWASLISTVMQDHSSRFPSGESLFPGFASLPSLSPLLSSQRKVLPFDLTVRFLKTPPQTFPLLHKDTETATATHNVFTYLSQLKASYPTIIPLTSSPSHSLVWGCYYVHFTDCESKVKESPGIAQGFRIRRVWGQRFKPVLGDLPDSVLYITLRLRAFY